MKHKLRIVLKNGNIREYHHNEFTDYSWRPDAFIVLNDDQWVAIFNWSEVREALYIEDNT